MWWYIVSLGFLIFGGCLVYLIITNRKVNLAIDSEEEPEEKSTATLAQVIESEVSSIEVGDTIALAEPGWIKGSPQWFKKAKVVGSESFMISVHLMKQAIDREQTSKKTRAKSKAKK